MKKNLLVWTAIIFAPVLSWGWGERGHHIICEVASQLTEEKALNSFLKSRTHMMGYFCNLPDSYWKGLDPSTKSGDATHYLNPENLGFSISNLPSSKEELLSKISEDKRAHVFDSLGSLWWRADQFGRLSLRSLQAISKAEAPSTKSFEQPYNKAVGEMISYYGIMGHFFGDGSMPFHNTSDYDGWKTGHGGIHSFYETDVVNELDITLIEEVFLDAKLLKSRNPRKSDSILSLARNVSISTFSDKKKIEQADRLLKPSKIVAKDGGEVKIPAERPSAKEAARKMKSLIVGELAQSAVALARAWDLLYVQAGRPDLTRFKVRQYPPQTPFVEPDYLPAKATVTP